jgi:hypothetical protein
MNLRDKIVGALRAPSKETQRTLWILHVVMVCVLLGFKLTWIVWDPGQTTASWAFTWVWVGVLGIGLLLEMVLRLRARRQQSALLHSPSGG